MQKKIIAKLFVVFMGCIWISCGNDGVPVDATEIGRQTVGPSGGTVNTHTGAVTLQIPTGALKEKVEIIIRKLDLTDLPQGSIASSAIELVPSGLVFEKPVKLIIKENVSNLTNDSWLRIVQFLSSKRFAPTKFIPDESDSTQTVGEIVQTGQYLLADLKMSEALIDITTTPITDVDVLFVIDNSGSMAQEQENLRQNFPKFIQALDLVPLNYRIGVVSTDLGAGAYGLPSCEATGGDKGKLQNTPMAAGCSGPTDPWIEKNDGTTNVPGDDVAKAFSCIAELGTTGCGYEQTLESTKFALDPTVNPGFIREDAGLAIVYITDEDDCSAKETSLYDPSDQMLTSAFGPLTSFRCFEFGITCDGQSIDRTKTGELNNCVPKSDGYLFPVQRYVDQIKQLKPQGHVVVAAITGPKTPVAISTSDGNPRLSPSCSSPVFGSADPAIRMASFIDAFGSQGSMHSICSGDFSPALAQVGAMVVTETQLSWCLNFDPIDTNPLSQDIDGDCVVVAKKAGNLPACNATSNTPCYKLEQSQTCGNSQTILRLQNISSSEVGDSVYAICLTPNEIISAS